MKVTSDGKPKILERIDCSGAGDVDMSKEVTRDSETGCVQGVSGRSLKVPDEWDSMNTGSTYRVGVKRIMDIYPRSLKDRILKERQDKVWGPGYRDCMASTAAKVSEHEAKNKDAKDPLTGMDKLAKDSLDNEVSHLIGLDKKFRETTYQVIKIN